MSGIDGLGRLSGTGVGLDCQLPVMTDSTAAEIAIPPVFISAHLCSIFG